MGRLAFLGPHATFTEQALRSLPESRGAELVPCAGSPAVLEAVRRGEVDAGCVPIENSVEGAVGAVLDGLVAQPPLVIRREALVAVRFAVMAAAGTDLASVRRVGSHPHAVAQTRGWLARHLPRAEVLLTSSTSEAAAQVARGDLDAAVAAPLAAEQHGLEIVVDDVADNPGAVTRFVLVAPPGPPPEPTGHDRTTFAATTRNEPGSLLGLLTELAVRGIDLTRIESRPIKDRHAEYWFHIDCTGHVADPAMGEALAALHRRCDEVRFLGSFPRAGNGAAPTAPGDPAAPLGAATGSAFAAAQAWLDGLRAGSAS
ncbi:prephenate dehydratase [Pseudonocardia sp. KRD-184]|uniref:Prephenate dehydratase n=1 Tax=Pseudonocardia oceani TaxID=2792013 RepID=A0ABS6U9B7_9PSEU|nr:prephenate dehydratase [Pseudonocardia oceani]MBW0093587.1 prephenate dehydratase [Pseudonocardia oceani]MBW0097650.1 prephenate dehydratase [Pseudonocardia oceani]MBW0113006.1 prephenate dehydratase [Pseudonocardia oceani]MBW0125499.1 prephenate dehydratase [Pseudonocardia oceani]MBW0128828.1 prephenate dehydratase [Pseudonocardia oceani]